MSIPAYNSGDVSTPQSTTAVIQYHFRQSDYARIRNWYEFARHHYLPSDPLSSPTPNSPQPERSKDRHFRLAFRTIRLAESYVDGHLKQLLQAKSLIFLASLFDRQTASIVTNGREIPVECEFDVDSLTLSLREEVALFFYLRTPSHYDLCFEIQMVSREGELLKFGASRYPL